MSRLPARDPRCDWLDELPLTPGPPDLRLGLRSLPRERWLPFDDDSPAELAYKADLLSEHDDLVLLEDGYDHAVEELVGLMEVHLGHTIERADRSPLDAAGRAVPDDLLVMAKSDHWRLVGGSLVFPNQWRLSEKIGLTLTEVHEPVDGYGELLADKLDRFFDRLAPNQLVWRRNWFLHDDPEFFQPDRMSMRPCRTADDASMLFVRSEWQTLRRLAFSGVIVFTVKTQVAPIEQLAARRSAAEAMCAFLEAASKRSLTNKDADDRHVAIVDYLRSEAVVH